MGTTLNNDKRFSWYFSDATNDFHDIFKVYDFISHTILNSNIAVWFVRKTWYEILQRQKRIKQTGCAISEYLRFYAVQFPRG